MIFHYRNYFYDLYLLLRKVTLLRLGNYINIWLSYGWSRIRRRPFIWAGPFSLSLETASACNLQCPECRTGQGKVIRKRKKMNQALANEIFQSHQRHAFYCNLYFQGEPFLHPEIDSIIRTASERNYYSVISTNGHFLHEENCRKIINSGLNRLIVSLDGIERASYEAYRKGGDFEKVIAGIKRMATQKKESKSRCPLLVVQFLVNKTNEHQLGKAAKYIQSLGADKVEFKSMQLYSDEGRDVFLPRNQRFNRYTENSAKKPGSVGCFRLWSHMVFTSDGEIVACCYDKIPEYIMGEDKTDSLEAWKSPVFQSFRKNLLRGEELPSICSNCGK